MGYKAEKEKMEKQLKRLKIICFSIVAFCFLGLCIFSAFVPPSTWKYKVGLPNVEKRAKGELRAHFIDVGQGDATLVEFPNGKVMLIDGGDGSSGATKSLLRYMNALKIDEIDDLILTHSDEDHCGGLTKVLDTKKVFNAYLPPSFPESGTKYAQYYAKLFKTDCKTYFTSRLIQFSCHAPTDFMYPYSVQCLYPYSKMVEDILVGDKTVNASNEASSVLYIQYAGVKVLLMGDAPQSVEEKLLMDDEVGAWESAGISLQGVSVLKVSHHGSATGTSLPFLQYLGVKDGIISCGAGNSYNHPAPETLARLAQANVNVYRTDVRSHIVLTVTADGQYSIDSLS